MKKKWSISPGLTLYKENREAVTNRKMKNFKAMWDIYKTRVHVTSTQIQNKWKTLGRAYKSVVAHNKKRTDTDHRVLISAVPNMKGFYERLYKENSKLLQTEK